MAAIVITRFRSNRSMIVLDSSAPSTVANDITKRNEYASCVG